MEQDNSILSGYHCEANYDCTYIRSYEDGFDDCALVEGSVTGSRLNIDLTPNYQETENRIRRMELELKEDVLTGEFIVNGQSFSVRYTRM